MIAFLAGLATAAVPTNPVWMVCDRDLGAARDRWLRIVLLLGSAWLVWSGTAWLGLMGFWCFLRWRDPALHPTLVWWAALGATWFLIRAVPLPMYDWIAWAWLAGAAYHVGWCVWLQKADWSRIARPSLGHRSKGLLGSPVITAFLFVLVAPFCPWWGWPVLAVGLYLTCSWTAAVALGVAMGWTWGLTLGWWPIVALGVTACASVAILAWSPVIRGQRVLEWTPRGDSLDGLWSRLLMARCVVQGWWIDGHRWLGCGPDSMRPRGRYWGSRMARELPIGEAHCDPLQTLYEYGIVGAAAMVAFAWPVVAHLRLGDPWSAAWVAGALIGLVHWPWRHPVLGLMLLTISARVIL